MPAADISLTGSRATVSLPLTNLIQGVVQPEFVMRLLYPFAEVATYGGTVISFDDTVYEDVSDDRADGAEYNEVQAGYSGSPYRLATKGLRFLVTDKRRQEMENLGFNWGEMATQALANKAGLRHEIEAAAKCTTIANYAPTNRITLSAGSRFSDASVDPDPIIRNGKDTVAAQIGLMPNVAVMNRLVFSALAARFARNFTSTMATTGPGMRQQLNEADLAAIFGFDRVAICDAIAKTSGGAKARVFGNHVVMGRVHPAALKDETIPFKPSGQISVVTPGMGYTYVMKDHPRVYNPWYNNGVKATVYDLDFDRQVVNSGVDTSTGLITYGYLIANAV